MSVYERCEAALRDRYGDAVWSDEQSQLIHRLPLQIDGNQKTVWVGTASGSIVDARESSDLIAKISGKAYWRKLFVERSRVDAAQARNICREIARGAVTA